MSVRVWELAALLVGVLVALGQFLTGAPGLGVAVLAGALGWFGTRVQLVDRPGSAGGFARRKGRLELMQMATLFVAMLAVVGTSLAAVAAGWNHDLEGRTAILALVAVELLLLGEVGRRGDSAFRLLKGADSEAAVGDELDPLREQGWFVFHDWPKEFGGNVDHVVCGPRGAFAIETKSGHFRRRDISQAAGNAAHVQRKLGVRWVQAVLCVEDPAQEPLKQDVVWVVGRHSLREWLLQQRESPVDTQSAATALAV